MYTQNFNTKPSHPLSNEKVMFFTAIIVERSSSTLAEFLGNP